MEQSTKDLPVELNEEEVAERSKSLALTVQEVADLEVQKAESSKVFATKIKDREKRIRELTSAVLNRSEKRPIPITERADVRRFTIEIVRQDTLEVIDTRAMTEDEIAEANQPGLFARATADSDDGGDGAEAKKSPARTGDVPCMGCSSVIKASEPAHHVLDRDTGDAIAGPGGALGYHCDGCHTTYAAGVTDAGGKKTKRAKKQAASEPEDKPASEPGTAITEPNDLLAQAERAAADDATAKH